MDEVRWQLISRHLRLRLSAFVRTIVQLRLTGVGYERIATRGGPPRSCPFMTRNRVVWATFGADSGPMRPTRCGGVQAPRRLRRGDRPARARSAGPGGAARGVLRDAAQEAVQERS